MPPRTSYLSSIILVVGLFTQLVAVELRAEIAFSDVSGSAGISRSGMTFGSFWGDFDADGLPDLWVGNHSDGLPSLYRNNGDGTFTDIGPQVVGGALGDPHGAAWADFDNDGDQDLIETHGGCCNNRFYVNQGGTFVESAVILGVFGPTSRGRSALWRDVDLDGRLDLVLATAYGFGGGSQPRIYLQTDQGFVESSTELGFDITHSTIALSTDQTGDGVHELLMAGPLMPMRVYESTELPLDDITSSLGTPLVSAVSDIAIGDFDGDGQQDFLSTRTGSAYDLTQVDAQTVQAQIVINGEEQAFTLETAGILTIEIGPAERTLPSRVYIGSAGWNPTSTTFDLDPSDPLVWGRQPFAPGSPTQTSIGLDPTTNTWTIAYGSNASTSAIYRVASTEPIGSAQVDWNAPPTPMVRSNLLLSDSQGGYSITYLADTLSACWNAATADFDNDMDQDVFLQCAGPASNYPNILLENLGDGSFQAVPDAGGAAGPTAGRGESVSVADYDLDGYLDLFLTNGLGARPLGDGPHQLFRNAGGTHHWLEIDLVGTVSNRDGVGATVRVSAGGVEQLREQRNGIHYASQDFQRIHVGLGANTVADEVTVQWPSGKIQRLVNVAADEILTVVEPIPTVPILPVSAGILALTLCLLGISATCKA